MPEQEGRRQVTCTCSFLEIYNETITDLLGGSQINLHIREDAAHGVYVEGLHEESVSTGLNWLWFLLSFASLLLTQCPEVHRALRSSILGGACYGACYMLRSRRSGACALAVPETTYNASSVQGSYVHVDIVQHVARETRTCHSLVDPWVTFSQWLVRSRVRHHSPRVGCRAAADMCALLARGQTARRVGETAMNRESSRSHSVLTCTLEAAATDSRGVTSVLRSRLNLVDLAGALTTTQHEQLRAAWRVHPAFHRFP